MTANTIEFKCYDPGATELYPPVPASKIIPDWYKQIPNTIQHGTEKHDVPTIKRCMPVLDYMTTGYVIRHAYQTDFKITKENGIQHTEFKCPQEEYVQAHPYEQCPVHMNGSKHNYLKFSQPWLVKTPPGYSCMFFQPHYNLNEDYVLFPSVVDTDKHDDSVNFVGYAKRDFVVNPGDPMVIVFPFKREDWQMKITQEDYLGKTVYAHYIKKVWHGTYARLFRSKKNYR
jgi:hypothetical protein